MFVTVLQNDGSVLASSITCAGLALIDASIHVFDVIIGSSTVSQGIDCHVFTHTRKSGEIQRNLEAAKFP